MPGGALEEQRGEVAADFPIGDRPRSLAPGWKPAPTRIGAGYTSI
jgi:hypothetical protein